MARYVGAAVMTAVVAAIYGTISADRVAAGEPTADALAAGFARAALVLAVVSAAGVALAALAARHRPPTAERIDQAAAAAAAAHTFDPHAPVGASAAGT
jgi:hypothetical protein